MAEFKQGVLPKNYILEDKYTILLFIKGDSNTETYRVKGRDSKIYFLKVFNYAKLPRSAFDDSNNLLESKILKSIEHKNITSHKDSGELIFERKKYYFLILNFIAGETLANSISREQIASIYDLKQIIIGILDGLNYLHTLKDPVIHNDISPQNIMLDLSDYTPISKIIDFGHARYFHQSSKSFSKEGLNLNYIASECFNSLYSPQSDIFSVGAVMYQILFGMPPWFKDISKYKADTSKAEDLIIEERKKQLVFSDVSDEIFDFDESILKILKKSLQNDPELRFQSAQEFKQALNGEIEIDERELLQKIEAGEKSEQKIKSQKVKGKGFDAIAGMKDLKAQLKLDVIDALHNPEEYKKYGVTIPNGLLLYGPPGCGKTFFAKHFAEEVGFNFMLIMPSTLKSKWINATQENIAKMFEEAEKNAPTIIFIDEINELLPSRDSDAHEMAKSAVNEMLAQMDRTGEKGIFIIGATNYPQMIDAAILRSGRLDKKFYLPPPDLEARKAMFEMYLKNRPLDFGIDYDKLSTLTEHRVSSDIEQIVVEASRLALKNKKRVSMSILEETINSIRPSVSIQELQKYEAIRAKMNDENNDQNNERSRIGFKP